MKFGCSPLSMLLHDLSKFYPREFGNRRHPLPYAWNHHANHNPHHCEYWHSRTGGRGNGDFFNGQTLPMPEKYIKEMLADWFGASRAYEGFWPPKKDWLWFTISIDKMLMHPLTRWRTVLLLKGKGYLTDVPL